MIYKLLKDTLSDSEILNLLPDREVYYLHAAAPTTPYVEYEVYDNNGDLYEEGEEISEEFSIQVDVFSTDDFVNIAEKIKEKMLTAGFEGGHGPDLYEKDTQLYHKILRFNYSDYKGVN